MTLQREVTNSRASNSPAEKLDRDATAPSAPMDFQTPAVLGDGVWPRRVSGSKHHRQPDEPSMISKHPRSPMNCVFCCFNFGFLSNISSHPFTSLTLFLVFYISPFSHDLHSSRPGRENLGLPLWFLVMSKKNARSLSKCLASSPHQPFSESCCVELCFE